MSRRVVIIGAGVGGWDVAHRLEPRAEVDDLEILLIDKRPYHEFQALLYEVATGAAGERSDEEDRRRLADGMRVNLTAYDQLLKHRHITFRHAEVIGIDRFTQRVRLRGEEDVPFDVLILALGAEPAFYEISGLRTHAIPLKTTRDALRIRAKIMDCIERAKRGTQEPARVLIGGGGATGVEFAAELAHALDALVRKGVIRRNAYEITLVESGSRLLNVFPVKLARIALQRLHHLGVRVFLDALVSHVDLGRVTLTPRPAAEGERREQLLCGFDGDTCTIDADCIVWTGGIQFPRLLSDAGFSTDHHGRVVVDDALLVDRERCIFALGDCASFTSHRATASLPPLAAIAVRQAPIVAQNVLAYLNRTAFHRFRLSTLPTIVPLGGKWAAFAYRGSVWVGRLPWYLRTMIDCAYFTGAFGISIGFRVWWRGARAYVRNDS